MRCIARDLAGKAFTKAFGNFEEVIWDNGSPQLPAVILPSSILASKKALFLIWKQSSSHPHESLHKFAQIEYDITKWLPHKNKLFNLSKFLEKRWEFFFFSNNIIAFVREMLI